ncbi:MAG: nitrate/nitrite transporter [Alphaproteobacteria bacterium]
MSGARPWLVWAAGALFFCYAFFLRTSPAVMADELMRDFSVGAALLGNLAAFYFYAYAAEQIGVGVLVDNFGPRRILTLAALLAVLGCLLFGTAQTLHQAYAGRLLIGFGAGFGWVASLALVARWFPQHRFALLSGLTALGGMVGAASGGAPLAALVDWTGWRVPMIGAAVGGAGLAMACWILVRDHPAPQTVARAARPSLLHSLRLASANRQTWIIAFYTGTVVSPFLGISSLWGVPYLIHVHGHERASAALIASLLIAGMALGSPLLGWASDKIGRRRPAMWFAIGIQAVGYGVAFYVSDVSPLLFGAMLFLAGIGGAGIIVGFATGREANDPQALGAAMGIVNTGVIGGGALIQPAIGMILDQHWEGVMIAGARIYSEGAYQFAFATLFASLALAFVATLFVRETWCGQQKL